MICTFFFFFYITEKIVIAETRECLTNLKMLSLNFLPIIKWINQLMV